MCEQILSVVSYIDWSELAKVVTSIWVAIIATLALTTWKRKLKTEQKTELLDKLTTAVHTFINDLSAPIYHLESVKIGFESWIPPGSKDKRHGAITFITKRGKEYYKTFIKSLKDCKEKTAEIDILIIKMQMHNFIDFNDCYNSCVQIIHQYNRLEGFAASIAFDYLNWDNPEVIAMIDNILAVDPKEIRSIIDKEKRKFLNFTKNNYKRIYK